MGPRGPQSTNTHSTIMTGGHYDASIPRLPGMPEPSGPPSGSIHTLETDGTEPKRSLDLYKADESPEGDDFEDDGPEELFFGEEDGGPQFFGRFE